jgi:hypothetical protein
MHFAANPSGRCSGDSIAATAADVVVDDHRYRLHSSTHSTETGSFGYWERAHLPASTAGSPEPRPGRGGAGGTRWTTDCGS